MNEGFLVKLDRANNNCFSIYDYYPDWLIYTEVTGSALSGGQGLIKMAFEIDLQWIEDKMSRLKEFDVNRLCGIEPEAKDEQLQIGKRKERDEESKKELTKEEKIQALKDRFMKRQKRKSNPDFDFN